MKKLTWVFVFLLVTTIVNAQSKEQASVDALNNATILKLHWYNASEDNSSIKALGVPTNGNAYFNTSVCYNKTSGCWWNTDHSSGNKLAIPWKGTNFLLNQTSGGLNLSVSFWINLSAQSLNNKVIFWTPNGDVNRGLQIFADTDLNGGVLFRMSGGNNFYQTANVIARDSWVRFVGIFNATDNSVSAFINGTFASYSTTSQGTPSSSGIGDSFYLGAHPSFSDRNFNGIVQCLNVYNKTLNYSEILYLNVTCPTPDGAPTPSPDTTPPEITYYNLTNENGCENWNTNKNNACSTSSVVPTVQFNTSENAWCAIAGSSSSTSLNLNYTEMGSSRNCTGAASGEDTREHFCTLTNQDELVYDTSYVYISCEDSSNNQNSTSTSGALKLSITGLEATGRTSIGKGIQNALLSGYTNYTDLQIYARNLSNDQVRGTFDRAAKKGSKMWAFNRIGVSDSHVNMFNLTPVLYVMEFSNITSQNITNQTQALIEATK